MRQRFSQRQGITTEPSTLQIDSMSDALRNSLWNLLYDCFEHRNEYWCQFVTCTGKFFFKVPVDDLPYHDNRCMLWLKQKYYKLEWHEVYDFIEFVADNYTNAKKYANSGEAGEFTKVCNYIFERELSGYRFISGILSPISSKEEVSEITEAVDRSSTYGLSGANNHLKTSLTLLGQKPTPDYRNSIKEAISAVESISKQISGSDSQGLSGALKKLSDHTELHGALKSAFEKLYGYSSDEDGIRHAILDEPTVGFDEAKFMIVSCSAFVNYLISKAEKAKLLK
ncbi:MAG: hypothetical protein HY761_10615 [Candidatus Omnitrophica bacterium]|nr:hypothetical protein [Candidatus Omnitrophota bacterium]